VRPRRGKDEDRLAFEPPREVADEASRLLVEPVQVVDRDDQRPALSELAEQPVQAVQGVSQLAPGRCGSEAEHARRQPRRPVQQLGALGTVKPAQGRAQQLAYSAERKARLELAAARPQDAVAHAGERLDEQRGLADPRRPLDQQRPARAIAEQPLHAARDVCKLGVALEQCRRPRDHPLILAAAPEARQYCQHRLNTATDPGAR
jgi:hypothetical protein